MIGKKKYTQAELDAAVDAAKRAATLDAQSEVAAAVRKERIMEVCNIVRQAPYGLLYTAAYENGGTTYHYSVSAADFALVFDELFARGWCP